MKVYDNYSLKGLNTFGIDVKARRLVVLEPDDEVSELDDEVLVLGGGSNMVFTKDYEGTVVTLDRLPHATLSFLHSTVTAWGGMVMDELIQWTLDNGLYGLENLSAIPGTVGASAVQNVGAYGSEAKDFIKCVEAYDLQERRWCTFGNKECQFAYRDSLFKHYPNRYLIFRVTYQLGSEYVPNLNYKALGELSCETAQHLREGITDLRWSKLPRPEEHGSAGSFFKNPVVDEATYRRLADAYPSMPVFDVSPLRGNPVIQSEHGKGLMDYAEGGRYKLSAGWLIDRAGWKGRTQGGAGVWPRNALVLYNAGGCTGAEVVALAKAIQEDVKQKFGVTLDPEAIII